MTTFQHTNRSHLFSTSLIGLARIGQIVTRVGADFAGGLAGLANERAAVATHSADRDTCDLRCASELFSQALGEESNIEMDWLWYAGRLERDDERIYCLQRALQINPRSHVARYELARLG